MTSSSSLDDPQKQEMNRRRNFSFRLNFFFFITFAVFSILIVKLAMLQFVEGPTLAKKEDQNSSKPVAIPPIRGNILDQTGYKIAYSTSTQSIYYRLGSEEDKQEYITKAVKLADVFTKYGNKENFKEPISPEEILKLMDAGYDMKLESVPIINYAYAPRRIKAGLSNEEIAYILEHQDEFTGLEVVEESIRNYDPSTIAVQLVGYLRQYDRARTSLDYYKKIYESIQEDETNKYLDIETVGYDGLELKYQKELRGKNGVKNYPVNAANKIVGAPTITKPEKGNNIWLTINKDVQLKTEQAIVDQIKISNTSSGNRFQYAPNARAGYAVAIEVDTGKVITMASMPDYDPKIWKTGRISEDVLKANQFALQNGTIRDAKSNWSDKELWKHPTSIVPLGSTQKPLTILVGLGEKLITPNTKYYDAGVFYFGRDKVELHNADNHAYGPLSPSKAIEKSSNTFMADMVGNPLYHKYNGIKGIDVWDSYMKQFGLGTDTGSDLPNESNGRVEYYHEAESGSPQSALIYASFGQQGKYTTLQLAQYAATLASRGKRMKPQFVDKITTNDNKEIVQGYTPIVMNEVNFPAKYWDIVQTGMENVKKQGFEGFPYRVASKTGTSQQSVAGKLVENAVFIAYAPADNPKIAIAVVVPEGGYGGYGAAPIARKIFDAYDEAIGLTGVPKKKTITEGQVTPPVTP